MIEMLRRSDMNSSMMYYAGFASIFLSIAIWFLRRGEDRANAERFGIFVGLWAPTLMILGRSLEEAEREAEGTAQTTDLDA